MSASPSDAFAELLGIGPDERPITYYRLLDLPRDVIDDEIIADACQRQLDRLARQKESPHAEAIPKLQKQLLLAQGVLRDPSKRSQYDAKLAQATARTRPSTADSDTTTDLSARLTPRHPGTQAGSASQPVSESAPKPAKPKASKNPANDPAQHPPDSVKGKTASSRSGDATASSRAGVNPKSQQKPSASASPSQAATPSTDANRDEPIIDRPSSESVVPPHLRGAKPGVTADYIVKSGGGSGARTRVSTQSTPPSGDAEGGSLAARLNAAARAQAGGGPSSKVPEPKGSDPSPADIASAAPIVATDTPVPPSPTAPIATPEPIVAGASVGGSLGGSAWSSRLLPWLTHPAFLIVVGAMIGGAGTLVALRTFLPPDSELVSRPSDPSTERPSDATPAEADDPSGRTDAATPTGAPGPVDPRTVPDDLVVRPGDGDRTLVFEASKACVASPMVTVVPGGFLGMTVENDVRPAIEWYADFPKPGIYRVEVTYAHPPAAEEDVYRLVVGSSELDRPLASGALRNRAGPLASSLTPDTTLVRRIEEGFLAIKLSGRATVTLEAVTSIGQEFMTVERVVLRPN